MTNRPRTRQISRENSHGAGDIAELLRHTDIALSYLDQVHTELIGMLQNPVSGDPVFEALSSMGGAICTVRHARGMVRELERGEG